MKVLVTGGCGFIGSHVCEYYRNQGAEVISFDNMTKHELKRTGFNAEAARDYIVNFEKKIGVNVVKGDIRNKEELNKVAEDCDFIVHTAAQPAMTISVEDPELDISTNVNGTFNVLEAARKQDCPVVFCSTVHVYGPDINKSLKEGPTRFTRNPPEITEDEPILQGTMTPLHASKRTGELYVRVFNETYGLKTAAYRFTGLYGPRQFGGEDHGWVANFSIRTIMNRPITIYGTDKQVRDILYATDAAAAFDAFYKTPVSGIYNVGSGTPSSISLKECIDMISDITKTKPEVNFAPARSGDLYYYISNISKAKKDLKWQPKVLPREGITNLINWIKENKPIFSG